MSDNFYFDIIDGPLEASLKVAFCYYTATCWLIDRRVDKLDRLIFAWHQDNSGYHPFISPVDWEEAMVIVPGFLKDTNYGPEPDHDGHNTKSFRIYNEQWGHIGNNMYAFAAVEPAWAMHGK